MNPSTWEPAGPIVTGSATFPPCETLKGNHISLVPLDSTHIPELYSHFGGESNAYLYKYMPGGPFFTLPSFTDHVESELLALPNSLFFTIFQASNPVGMIAFINTSVRNRSIEIGYVLFAKSLQRTTAATEAVVLLMRSAFELGFLRVEWKCNSLNLPSERAAKRLGFVREGLFRAHLIVKGKRRDTVWLSVVEEEWEVVGRALEIWLREDNFAEGKQKRKLEEVREEVAREVLSGRKG